MKDNCIRTAESVTKGHPDISHAVESARDIGAGDQGIMYGYACDETEQLLPMPVVLAHQMTQLLTDARETGIIPELLPDGKSQVSVEYENGVPKRVGAVVVSCQHRADANLEKLRRAVKDFVIHTALWDIPADNDTQILINPSGRFVLGEKPSFAEDAKIMGLELPEYP